MTGPDTLGRGADTLGNSYARTDAHTHTHNTHTHTHTHTPHKKRNVLLTKHTSVQPYL